MIASISNWIKKSSLKSKLFAFLNEMEKNLEVFYVMDQRQFITQGFHNQQWGLVNEIDFIKKNEAIRVYIGAIEDFNKTLSEFKKYEQWYAGDVKNKNQENAKKLHADKHVLDKKLKAMEAVIIPAGQELEREMLKLGFIRQ